MKIKVEEPYWKNEWLAIDDDSYCGCGTCHPITGQGSTAYAAVQDMRDNFQDKEDDDGIMACDIWLMANREVA